MKGLWPLLLLGGWWLIKQLVAKGTSASSQQAHQTWLAGVKKDIAASRSGQTASVTLPAAKEPAAAPPAGRAASLRTRPTRRPRPAATATEPLQTIPVPKEESPHVTEACDLLEDPVIARAPRPPGGGQRTSLRSHMRDRTSLQRAVVMAELLERPISLR